jgi:hypothetical protein
MIKDVIVVKCCNKFMRRIRDKEIKVRSKKEELAVTSILNVIVINVFLIYEFLGKKHI